MTMVVHICVHVAISAAALTVLAEARFASGEDEIFWWADRHGVNRSAVEVGMFQRSGGVQVRGLGAARKIRKGEVIMAVPKRLWLSSNREPSVDACRELWATWDGWSHEQVILQLLLERSLGESSAWYEYISLLPSLADLAEFYPYAAENLTREFQGLPIIDDHKTWRRGLWKLRDWVMEHRDPRCFEAGTPSAEEFLWADCVASSRVFGRDRKGDIREKLFLPLIDLANSPSTTRESDPTISHANTEWIFSNGFAKVIAIRPIARGEEISEAYGEAWSGGMGFILDTWGFIQETTIDKIEALPHETCLLLEPAIVKYLGGNTCKAKRVLCNLARLAQWSCPSLIV
eukprot:TRINITY_DN6384_c0_g1_i1.p1 TRINITY_DN6384_c0_g1~~TRINITY_DN6384_c0_g1_i1.p1  ORF type:complete len:354 (+),score=44.09 TRINITY_DN6384_c0_g1_i1:25-1062(+)